MNKKITMYEARLNEKYSYDQISRGEGVTEIEALTMLKASSKKFELSLDQLKNEYAIIEKIDITNEVNKYKKKADKILDRLQDILNMIPRYDDNIYVWGPPNQNKSAQDCGIVITHNLRDMRNQTNENYKKIFSQKTTKGILKFRQFISDIHQNFFIRYNNWEYYYPGGGNAQSRELKPIETYTFVNPSNVYDSNVLHCRYFGNLDQDFGVDFESKYANEILASSFSTRGYSN
jgi:hypothetical protein